MGKAEEAKGGGARMSPARDAYPPVQVFTTGGLEWLTRRRVEELRAKGIRYEVIDLETLGWAEQG